MACNLDSFGSLDGVDLVVEAKSAHWRDKQTLEDWTAGLARPTGKWASYWVQVQHQLEVTGCDVGHLAVLIDRDFTNVVIMRDGEFGRFLRRAIGTWWHTHIDGKVLPDAVVVDAPALSRIRATEGKEIDLTELGEVVTWLRELKAKHKDSAKEIKALESLVKSAMGDAEVGNLGDGIKPVTWKSYERKASTRHIEATTYRTFRA